MKPFSLCCAMLALLFLLSACGRQAADEHTFGDPTGGGAESISGTPAEADFTKTDSDMFTDRDSRTDYDANTSIPITLNGSTAVCNSDAVQISGTTVTLQEEGTYILTGSLQDGTIVVDANDTDKLQLVLNGVSVTGNTCAALCVLNADKVFVTLAQGTQNTLANGGSFTPSENNIDGAVFSKQDLTFNGSGSLTVTSPAGHGIVCKDDLVFTGGTYTINSASHGLDANDSVRIVNASLTVDAGKDGIHAENEDDAEKGYVYLSDGTINIQAEGDGISASAYMQIDGGTIALLTGGGAKNGSSHHSENYGNFMGGRGGGSYTAPGADESSTSMKGIKATGSILLSDGTYTIDSADDSIHANGSIIINGGNYALSSGDDGIHADEKLTITAGAIHIADSYEGLEALEVSVTGGKISLVADDDGINAAGGTDSSGTTGGRDGMFGGRGGMGGKGSSSSSNGKISISGGNIQITASGDGLDANGSLEITGGYTVVTGPTQGDTATLDFDTTGTIAGGTFIGTGASGMAQTFSDSKQGVVAVRVGNQSAGTTVTLRDKSGNTVLSHAPELPFQVVILSSPDIQSGESYTVTVGSDSVKITAD